MKPSKMARVQWAVVIALIACGGVDAETLRLDKDSAAFSVVVRKAGIARGLAHDHLLAAPGNDAVTFGREGGTYTFEARFDVAALVVDDPDLKQRLEPRLLELGVLDNPFTALSESQRSKVRAHMLAPDQLDAETYPTITVALPAWEPVAEDGMAALSLEIHGVTVQCSVRAAIVEEEGTVEVEAWGPLRFSDFGIKPYSAMLGALRNQDEFFLYVRFRASTTGEAP